MPPTLSPEYLSPIPVSTPEPTTREKGTPSNAPYAQLSAEGQAFYDRCSARAAQTVMPLVCGLLQPSSVIDFGCGAGDWLTAAAQFGCKVTGIDGPWNPPPTPLVGDALSYVVHDLRRPYALPEGQPRYSVALCLEVAEYLEEQYADLLVQTLTSSAEAVVFAAAVPQQGGNGHVNERPPEYWEAKFLQRGFVKCAGLFDGFNNLDDEVPWWYALNLTLYLRRGHPRLASVQLAATEAAFPKVDLSKVIPVIMTCPVSIGCTRRFVESYRAQPRLPRPVLSVDVTGSSRLPRSYLDLLEQLSPRTVHVHSPLPGASPYDSIQDAAFFAVEKGMEEALSGETWLLFLEDDVLLSSRFTELLTSIRPNPRAAFYTFYQPGGGYGSEVVTPGHFYGSQCLLIPFEAARIILGDREKMEQKFPPGYDIRWSRWLAWEKKRRIFSSEASYVQHIGISRMNNAGHTSDRFIP